MTESPPKPAEDGLEPPAGYALVEELAARPGVRVLRATKDGRAFAVRLERGVRGRESLAELAVLAAVVHPGLSRLADHGVLPDGRGSFVAREWVTGSPLSALRGRADAREVGRIVVRLGPALEHLHRLGFVHGDLKPANVLVAESGEPVLTDFGLSTRGGEPDAHGDVSGTYLYLAPEVLLGGPPDARSDVFALGVLLHTLLRARPVDARAFYGRFPGESFLAAAGTRLDELPEWSREWIEELTAREPARRPASALEATRALARRLGIEAAGDVERAPRIDLSAARVWGDFVAARLESATRESHPAHEWWRTADAEDARVLAAFASVQATLGGARSLRVDLDAELARVEHGLALDEWCANTARSARGALLWVVVGGRSSAGARALQGLRRAPADTPYAGLIAIGTGAPPRPEWDAHEAPGPNEETILTTLSSALEDTDDRLATLAERLHAESGGSRAVVLELLGELVNEGWILAGDERARLRPGTLPAWLGRTRRRVADASLERIDAAERSLLGAVCVLGGRVPLDHARVVSGLDRLRFGAAVDTVCTAGLASLQTGNDGLQLVSPRRIEALGLADAEQRELHRRAAELLEDAGAPRRHVLLHRYQAELEPALLDDLVAEVRRLHERGSPELAVALATDLGDALREGGADAPPALLTEEAVSWAALGEVDRARSRADALEAGGRPALAERVRGHIARARRDWGEALRRFERALELDPSAQGDALHAKAVVLYEARAVEPLEALVLEAEQGQHGALSEGVLLDLGAMVAMGRYRAGRIADARELLERMLERALALGEPAVEAVVRVNLGNVARATGAMEEAVEQLSRAAERYEEAGHLPGVAQARALLGAALRDHGRLRDAERPLASALGIRERAGDAAGAAAVRGILGWLHLERCRLKSASLELEDSARELAAAGRELDAALLSARALEARARLGQEAPHREELEASVAADPRVGTALARAARARGDDALARSLAERARAAAAELGRSAVAAEAAHLVDPLAPLVDDAAPAAVGQDARLLAELGRAAPRAGELRALAEELEEGGRDDRAVRAWLALAARTGDAHALENARSGFADCSAGTTEQEARFLQTRLLGFEDPWPADLGALEAENSEDWDMDVLSVLEINQRLVEQQDLPTLLGTIVESAMEMTGAERGFLALEEDGELSLDLAMDSRRGDIDEPEVEVSHSILGRALDEGRTLRLSNATEDPEVGGAPSVAALELRSILCEPFEVQPGLRGAIYLDNRLRSGAFDDHAERLLGLLAGQAALAIRQVRRLDEIRHLNEELGREVVEKETDLAVARRELAEVGIASPVGGLVGATPAMRAVHALLARIGPSDLPVLVAGASGTGKELAARALHELSGRKEGPFVSENCAALPPSLIESELFGFKKGAFTGADRDHEGLFERASGGTLFLDEIAELPLELQAKLLRVLEMREVRRVGESTVRPVDFRLVAATNRDLGAEVTGGTFRADLMYRLDGVRVEMPMLEQRVEDVPLLVDHFLRLEAKRTSVKRACAPDVLRRLCQRAWPGNVRELANEIARLCVLSEGDLVDAALVREPHAAMEASVPGRVRPLSEVEREAIEAALQKTNGDKRRAAELLGISRAKIYQRLKEWRGDET